MTIFKRAIAGVSVIALLAVSACAGQTGNQVAQTVVTDANTLATGLAAELPALAALPGANTAAIAKIKADVADLQKATSALSASLTTTEAQPLVQQIEADVNALVAAGATLPLPAGVSVAFQAAEVLLPVLEAGVSMAVPAGAAANAMTPDQAVAVLKAAAAQ
jgi:hypothetical protein